MAAPLETVAWVRPPEPIRGLDHLGVQAPCIALYGRLLPGIMRVVEAPEPVFTQPRVSRAQQILRDLCLVEYDDEGVMVLPDEATHGKRQLTPCVRKIPPWNTSWRRTLLDTVATARAPDRQ